MLVSRLITRTSGTSLPYVSTGGGTSEGFAGAARSSVAGAPSPVAACRRRCDTTSRMSREPAVVEPDGGAAGQRGVVDVAGVGVGRQPHRWRQRVQPEEVSMRLVAGRWLRPAPAGDPPVQECAGRPVQVLTEHHELSPCRPGRRTIAGPAKGSRGRGLADGNQAVVAERRAAKFDACHLYVTSRPVRYPDAASNLTPPPSRYARGAVGDVGVRSPVAGLAGTGVELAMPVWTLRNLVAFDHVDLLAAFRAMKVHVVEGHKIPKCPNGHSEFDTRTGEPGNR